jgi:hypothetical protein
MSWEAIWTMLSVVVGAILTVGIALTPFLWRIAVNSGRQTEAMEAMREDIHDMKKSFERDRAEMKRDIRILGRRIGRINLRVSAIEQYFNPTKQSHHGPFLGPNAGASSA